MNTRRILVAAAIAGSVVLAGCKAASTTAGTTAPASSPSQSDLAAAATLAAQRDNVKTIVDDLTAIGGATPSNRSDLYAQLISDVHFAERITEMPTVLATSLWTDALSQLDVGCTDEIQALATGDNDLLATATAAIAQGATDILGVTSAIGD